MKIHVKLRDGVRLKLEKFGQDLICIDPVYGFNKEREDYINLKKELFLLLFSSK